MQPILRMSLGGVCDLSRTWEGMMPGEAGEAGADAASGTRGAVTEEAAPADEAETAPAAKVAAERAAVLIKSRLVTLFAFGVGVSAMGSSRASTPGQAPK